MIWNCKMLGRHTWYKLNNAKSMRNKTSERNYFSYFWCHFNMENQPKVSKNVPTAIEKGSCIISLEPVTYWYWHSFDRNWHLQASPSFFCHKKCHRPFLTYTFPWELSLENYSKKNVSLETDSLPTGKRFLRAKMEDVHIWHSYFRKCEFCWF